MGGILYNDISLMCIIFVVYISFCFEYSVDIEIIMDKFGNFLKSAEDVANALGTSGSGQVSIKS